MQQTVRFGISTCPNDTFAFHALLTDQVDRRGLNLEIELLDIQKLNAKLFRDEFEVAKASFNAACQLADRTFVLPSGAALGFGVGPLLLSAKPGDRPRDLNQLTLCPGEHTTAHLLFEMFYTSTTAVDHAVFSEILPRLTNGTADFGVCIHEGRFTWEEQGVGLVEDLGTRWETETGCPLPLGGIVARRSLPHTVTENVQDIIHDSIQIALSDPESTLPTMRKYAQEFDDEVLMKHVELYVNEWTVDLGEVGAAALSEFSRRVPRRTGDLEIFGRG